MRLFNDVAENACNQRPDIFLRDSIMEDQDDLIIRKPECDELGSELNAKAALEDVGYNANLYIAIQEDNTQN